MSPTVRDREGDEEDGLASVAVVDYGINNLRSATRGLERAGAAVQVATAPHELEDVDGVVLPGVGAFGDGMENAAPFRDALHEVAADGRPLLGICLGMQMLLSESEEAERAGQGDAEGLDLIPGRNVRFREAPTVPHMGWNDLRVERDHPFVTGVDDDTDARLGSGDAAVDDRPAGGSVGGEHAYFVHSYYAEPEDPSAVVATAEHGVRFPAVVANGAGNVVGTQFHPEKSGEAGLWLLRNFVDVCARSRRA